MTMPFSDQELRLINGRHNLNTTHGQFEDGCNKFGCLRAPAKLNLGLKIVGKRSDGYHLLQSLFWPIDLTDKISITPSESLTVSYEWSKEAPRLSSLPIPPEDLVSQIAVDLELQNYRFKIQKKIPIGAGLGGGSSDAGTIIKGFGLSESDEKRISRFGADIPFFMNPRPSWVEGIGELVIPIQMEPTVLHQIEFALVIPNFGMATEDVFRSFGKSHTFSPTLATPRPNSIWGMNELENYLNSAENDLEKSAFTLRPELEDITKIIKGFKPLYAGMSGSGSTLFGVWPKKFTQIKELTQELRSFECSVLVVKSYAEDL